MDYPHIVKTPGVCAGLPRIEGTRITVNLIVRQVVQARRTPDDELVEHPHLSLVQVYAALAYYFDNYAAVDASMREADVIEATLRAQFPSRLGF